jgi:DNA-directed RNA polymerase sigma subunit (sigma70/sigma32)
VKHFAEDTAGRSPHDGAAASFEEIGRALGITRGGAWMLYQNALRKLRHPCNAAALRRLQELCDLKLRREL